MKSKLLSVSIAAYNVEKTLKEVLEPFCGIKNKEALDVMIVNDGSKDGTKDIALEYERKYPGMIRYIEKENGGWGSTLNVGFKEAKGKYFKQLDGDDFFSTENLEDFLEYLETVDTDMIYSPFLFFEDGTGAISRVAGIYPCFTRNTVYYLNEIQNFMPAMHCLTVKTDILRKNNISITEHCFYTDVEFVIKSYNCCETMAYYEKPIYYYRIAREGQSMSVSGVKRHYRDHEKMLLTMLQYYEKHVKDEEKKKAVENRLIDVCNMQYSFFCLLPTNQEHKKEFMQFDSSLKNYPLFYNQVKGRFVTMLRQYDFKGYRFIAAMKTNRDKKNKWNFFAE